MQMDRNKMRVCLYSLGCKVNGYETERMTEEFREAGYQIVPPFEAADVYIINTCTVTNIADRKSRKMLRHAAKANPDAIVVAAGCYVDAEKQFGVRDADEHVADLWVANKEKKNIIEIVEEYLESRGPAAQGSDGETAGGGSKEAGNEPEKTNDQPTLEGGGDKESCAQRKWAGSEELQHDASKNVSRADDQEDIRVDDHTRAYLKIQDGCNQFCSYCIIPFARGRVVSRKPEEILAEAGRLATGGFREIVLTGIHISSYGLDFQRAGEECAAETAARSAIVSTEEHRNEEKEYAAGPAAKSAIVSTEEHRNEEKEHVAEPTAKSPEEERTKDGNKPFDLIDLVSRICNVDGIDRVRLGSMEPRIITEENIRILAGLKKVCPHFHLSLQSGCDATLKRMNRHYTTAEYLEKCEIIRRYFPDAAITTDVIVGFPGETEEEFETTKAFLAEVRFARMHIFKYSARRGTRAAAMENQIPEQVKDARSAVLRKLNLELEEAYVRSFLGRTEEVLFEESAAGEWVGHTAQYLKVGVETDKDLRNLILPVRLTEAYIDGGEVRMRGEVLTRKK